MLQARKVSWWRNSYQLVADGELLATWTGRVWRGGGTVDLAGQRHEVAANAWSSRFEMTDEAGAVVAAADRVGRKRWTVAADGRTYRFRRASWWRSEELLDEAGQPVGSVRRVGWGGTAVADLPGLSLPVQVFVLVVALAKWEAQSAAAA
ncbi:MAG TPA: hypothetical protein VFV67_01425 [Actinophytocola sp.]|uniref:hypothetical protein n=1 Tax=Actinophytocola sp. TaxID=1872138 RepID=UPI002DBB17F5|nr:hypothetical protein [Actinophytocola sp.]HEU5469284.1 hypothetical protein [Actinophytocola sp.]